MVLKALGIENRERSPIYWRSIWLVKAEECGGQRQDSAPLLPNQKEVMFTNIASAGL